MAHADQSAESATNINKGAPRLPQYDNLAAASARIGHDISVIDVLQLAQREVEAMLRAAFEDCSEADRLIFIEHSLNILDQARKTVAAMKVVTSDAESAS